jgi:predicted small lipoprotein YifL
MIRPRAALCLVAAMLVLAGCGRRGALEPPPGTAASDQSAAAGRLANGTQPATAGGQGATSLADTGTPGVLPNPNEAADLPSSSAPGSKAPKKGFFLDPLL